MALVCLRLGFWQLDRLHQRRAANEIAVAARAAPVVSLDPANMGDRDLWRAGESGPPGTTTTPTMWCSEGRRTTACRV